MIVARTISFLKRIRRLFFSSHRPFRLTRGGWVFVLYTIGVGAGAINTGNNLLYLIFGIFLGLLLASGVLSDASLWRLRSAVHFPEVAEAGRSVLSHVQLFNAKKRIPSLSIRVRVSGRLRNTEVVAEAYFSAVAPSGRESRHVLVGPLTRGRFAAEHLSFSTQFPFGLLRKRWTYARADAPDRSMPLEAREVFVYPAVFPLSLREIRSMEKLEDAVTPATIKGDGSSVHGIREYQSGDNPKLIHWRASAKRGMADPAGENSWLIREMETEQKDDVALLWPALNGFPRMDEKTGESFLSFVASVMFAYEKNHCQVRILVPESASPDTAWRTVRRENSEMPQTPLLRFLSVFEPARPRDPEALSFLEEFDAGRRIAVKRSMSVLAAYEFWKSSRRSAA